MLTALRPRRRPRRPGERGAVAVEAAIITPLLVLLVLGIIEFSLVLRDYVSVTSATRSGARIASANAGAGPQVCDAYETVAGCSSTSAPQLALAAASAVQLQGSALNKDQIQYLLVYKADASGYPGSQTSWSADPKADCLGAGRCVVYTWVKASNKFRFTGGGWQSSTINACVSNSDSVGVYLRSLHPYATKMFGSSIPVSDRTVMRFEPLTASVCAAGNHP